VFGDSPIFWHAARFAEPSFDSIIRMDRADIFGGFWGSELFKGGLSDAPAGEGVFSANFTKSVQ
jgi:hypothetical protein